MKLIKFIKGTLKKTCWKGKKVLPLSVIPDRLCERTFVITKTKKKKFLQALERMAKIKTSDNITNNRNDNDNNNNNQLKIYARTPGVP